jgi:hypothetical protein
MPSLQFRFPGRAGVLAGAALAAMVTAAAANDLPGTPEGANKIRAFIETYAGKAAAAAPALTVTPEAAGYAIAFDIGALTAALNATGVVYDSAVVKLMAFEQDDGAWRLEQTELPSLSGHSTREDAHSDFVFAGAGYRASAVMDPALSWLRDQQAAADKIGLALHGPGVNETVEIDRVQANLTSKAAPEGAVSTAIEETFGALSLAMSVDPRAFKPDADSDGKPFDLAMRSEAAGADIKLDGLKTQALLDLWAFWVAHPTRPELAANEAAFKGLISAALAGRPSFAEEVGMKTLDVRTPKGEFAVDGVQLGLGGAVAGSDSRFSEHFAANGLKLPPEIVPEMYRGFVPTEFDVGFKVSGINLTAAAEEAVADLRLSGDDPPISREDHDRIVAKLAGGGPVVIDIPPSRVRAPEFDLAFEGQVRYLPDKPTGTITLHMQGFDKTVSALKGLGPEAQAKMAPVIAMAKGLAKTDGDGALSWVGEIGADGMMKINGLPLGKAPFGGGSK